MDELSMEDADVLIAVRALGDMRSGAGTRPSDPSGVSGLQIDPSVYRMYSQSVSSQPTPALSIASSSSRSTVSEETPQDPYEDDTFVSRVSNLPLVNTALRAYEQGKASSRVVKYGAEMMEGTVKTMTRPVMDRLPVNQLDEFARRQLDRFYPGRPEEATIPQTPTAASAAAEDASGSLRGRKHLWIDNNAIRDSNPISRESSVGPAVSENAWSTSSEAANEPMPEQPSSGQEIQVVSRSKWQAVLLEAGGIGAAVSEESMKRLKYCLQWLQYATAHIDQQILLLRSFVTSITPNASGTSSALVPLESLQLLAQVKSELVSTIRQVVDVVSKYAGGALPEQARASVRTVFLMLPERWASAARAESESPISSVYDPARGQQAMHPGAAALAAARVMTLAIESLDMMRSVTGVFKESLDRAEAWVDRLQQLGLQRQQQNQQRQIPVSHWEANIVARANASTLPPNPFAQATPAAASPTVTSSSQPSSCAAGVDDSGDDTETEGGEENSARLRRRRRRDEASTAGDAEDREMDMVE